ncbi:hypothetical protein [Streptococcus thermophilus]|uniref:hypothetical protein n=1 Tax=Streptococcus thermophilus TaxID=1308 RepID=UPI001428651D|nr:hypothetical protein [Streptococcus thermophilus]QIS48364.1 amino acid ABC transporter periplasmic protein [Streptococcus thermophilus]
MTTTVKINSSSIAKLKSAISSTDINAKKKLIAGVFVLAYGYEKVSKTTFEDWDIDEAIKIIEAQGVIVQEQLKLFFPKIDSDKKLLAHVISKNIEQLADDISK